jgi:hypothetical protein
LEEVEQEMLVYVEVIRVLLQFFHQLQVQVEEVEVMLIVQQLEQD